MILHEQNMEISAYMSSPLIDFHESYSIIHHSILILWFISHLTFPILRRSPLSCKMQPDVSSSKWIFHFFLCLEMITVDYFDTDLLFNSTYHESSHRLISNGHTLLNLMLMSMELLSIRQGLRLDHWSMEMWPIQLDHISLCNFVQLQNLIMVYNNPSNRVSPVFIHRYESFFTDSIYALYNHDKQNLFHTIVWKQTKLIP